MKDLKKCGTYGKVYVVEEDPVSFAVTNVNDYGIIIPYSLLPELIKKLIDLYERKGVTQ